MWGEFNIQDVQVIEYRAGGSNPTYPPGVSKSELCLPKLDVLSLFELDILRSVLLGND